MTLEEIERDWLKPNETGRVYTTQEEYWWRELACPSKRGFFDACRNAAENGSDGARLGEWLSCARSRLARSDSLGQVISSIKQILAPAQTSAGRTEDLRPTFLAHLLCAHAVQQPDAFAYINDIAGETGLCDAFVRELIAQLRGDLADPMPSEGDPVELTALFIDNTESEPQGVLGRLTLQRMLGNSDGCLYRHPSLAFVGLGGDFEESLRNASACVKEALRLWTVTEDVRWNLVRPDGKPLPPMLVGDSMGGAFALGLAKLFA